MIRQRLLAAGAGIALSAAGAFIGLHEGEVRYVYGDVGGVSTYCFGGTQRITKQEYTEHECTEQLLRDAEHAIQGVQSAVQREVPQSVLVAMTSTAYNAGVHGFKSSPMLPHLREGKWEAACAAIVAPWKTSKGIARGWRATVNLVPHKGLENRRQAEYEICLQDLRRDQP